eukprot:1236693-Rhodomonas_salina.1
MREIVVPGGRGCEEMLRECWHVMPEESPATLSPVTSRHVTSRHVTPRHAMQIKVKQRQNIAKRSKGTGTWSSISTHSLRCSSFWARPSSSCFPDAPRQRRTLGGGKITDNERHGKTRQDKMLCLTETRQEADKTRQDETRQEVSLDLTGG